jgi:hypothetical protein
VNMGNGVEVEVEYINTAKLVLASGHFFRFRRSPISLSILDKSCNFFLD